MSRPTIYALHEHPEWFPPFAAAFAEQGVEVEEWLLTDGVLDLDAAPVAGGVLVADQRLLPHARPRAVQGLRAGVLSWLEAHGDPARGPARPRAAAVSRSVPRSATAARPSWR